MNILQIPGDMGDVKFTRNRAASFKFETDEDLSDEIVAKASIYSGKRGWFFFAAEPMRPEDIDPPPMPKREGKTQSQRLRNVLWVRAGQLQIPEGKRQEYYETRMERFINEIKEELED